MGRVARVACEDDDSCRSAAAIMQCNTQGARPCRANHATASGLWAVATMHPGTVSIPLLVKYSPLTASASSAPPAMMRGGAHGYITCTYTASLLTPALVVAVSTCCGIMQLISISIHHPSMACLTCLATCLGRMIAATRHGQQQPTHAMTTGWHAAVVRPLLQ